MIFPPTFFDIMVHLTVHLVREIQMCGPVYLRWMYPIERYMKILKGYVKSRSRPEGCIVEGYIIEEAIDFCTDYLSGVENIGIPKSRHTGRTVGEGLMRSNVVSISTKELDQAHHYVLHNSGEIESFVDKHMDSLRRFYPMKSETWITKEHNRTFVRWLSEQIIDDSVSDRVKWLAKGPRVHVLSYTRYLINGYTFYTEDQDDHSTMQNSGVSVFAQSMHISSAKDRNPIYAKMAYYGVINRIWELDYTTFQVPIFGCRWVHNNGIRLDESGLLLVDLKKVGYKDEPFILASQAQQVFYVADPGDKKWSVVLMSNKNMEDNAEAGGHLHIEDDVLSGISQSTRTDVGEEDVQQYKRADHEEGIWIRKIGKKTLQPSRKRKR